MYFVYILYSEHFDRYYVGQTDNLLARLLRHNKGLVRSTKAYTPWSLKYSEAFENRVEAMRREREIKKRKSRKYVEQLIASDSPSPVPARSEPQELSRPG